MLLLKMHSQLIIKVNVGPTEISTIISLTQKELKELRKEHKLSNSKFVLDISEDIFIYRRMKSPKLVKKDKPYKIINGSEIGSAILSDSIAIDKLRELITLVQFK